MVGMKRVTHRLVVGVSLLILVFVGALSVLPASAAPVSIALSSSASSVLQNSTFVVTATVNTSGEVSDALVRVNYDSSKISYISASYSGYPLDQDFGSQAGPNYYIADRYKLGAPFPSGSVSVVRLTFRASVSSGSTTLNVDTGASTVGNAATAQPHTPLTANGVTVNFTAPPAPASTPAPTTTPNTSSPDSSSSPSSNTSTPQNQPADQPETGQPTAQEQEINSTIDDDQPVPVGPFIDQTGYPVEVRIVDANGDPVVGLEVTIIEAPSRDPDPNLAASLESKATTNEDGIAEFSNIIAGEYTVEANGIKGTVSITIGDPLFAQEFSFTQEETSDAITYILIVVAILALLGAIGFAVMRIMKNRHNDNNYTNFVNDTPNHGNDESKAAQENDPRLEPDPPRVETVISPSETDDSI